MYDDEFDGIGGSYVIQNGKRVRVETTEPAKTITPPSGISAGAEVASAPDTAQTLTPTAEV
jgi:hypothetical protein